MINTINFFAMDLKSAQEEISNLKKALEESELQRKSSEQQVKDLQEIIQRFNRKIYGSSSEKIPSDQINMFDEAEFESLNEDSDDVEDTITVPEHERKKRGKREKIPDSLPREIVVIDLEDKTCPNDNAEFVCIGEDVSERLEIIPSKLKVIRTIIKKYACKTCESIRTGKVPLEMIPKSLASASLLSYIAVSKYADALPLYRQEAMFKRVGIELHRQTMARWMITIGEKIDPLITLLREELLNENYLHMDETVVQVLEKDEDEKARKQSYMWVQARSGINPIILFHYGRSRNADHPRFLLESFNGFLHVDGYGGYDPVCRENKITRLGCWAHARRKFFDAFKSSQGTKIGKQGLDYFKRLYKIEDQVRGKSIEEKFYQRLKSSVAITKEFKEWIDDKIKTTPPKSMAGKALSYSSNEWEFLMNCFSTGECEIDNNYIEAHIRPFTIGRKNWMFSATENGARASANLYSLIETAKANGKNPFEYLTEVFKKLPMAQTEQDFLDLLPIKVKS